MHLQVEMESLRKSNLVTFMAVPILLLLMDQELQHFLEQMMEYYSHKLILIYASKLKISGYLQWLVDTSYMQIYWRIIVHQISNLR